MRTTALIGCTLAVLLIYCGEAVRTDADEALQVVHAFHAAFDAKDLDALVSLCDEEMFWYTLNGRALGRHEISRFFRPLLADWKNCQTTVNDFHIRRVGQLAVIRYKSIIHISTVRGENKMNNLHTMVLIKKAAGWKIWQHHMSTE